MAIAFPLAADDFRRVIDVTVTTNTTIAITKPPNVANGELMLLRIASADILNPSSISISGSGYWTLVQENYSTANGASEIHMAWYWAIWETGDATSWTATFGGDIRDDESYVQRVTGAHPTAPIGAEAASISFGNTVSPISPTVTTTVNNSAVIFDVAGRNGNNLTAENTGNPTGTTLIQNKRSRANSSAICSGISYELFSSTGATGTRTWTNYFTTNSIWSAFAFEILPEPPLQTITDINSGAAVDGDSSGNTFTTTGFTEDITDVEIDGLACTNVDETAGSGTFEVPPPVDGEFYPELGVNQDVTISGATQSAILAKMFELGTYTITSLVDPELVDITYPTALFDVTPVSTDLMITEDGITPSADGGVTLPAAAIKTIMHWVRATGVMYIYSFEINQDGVVTNSIVARHIVARSPVARSIAARFLSAGFIALTDATLLLDSTNMDIYG